MKGLLIVPLVLVALSGCAENSAYHDTASGHTFIKHPTPPNNGKVGNPNGGGHFGGR